ncbi:MAG: EAL domain-containing protein [Gammaproteobacteria bacterium]|nr:EAL domain-containing protein [Gammaproteobacteria bacterium]MCP5137485.1 EAL domain-containing protein [Gammaproteobacteria bacterium]
MSLYTRLVLTVTFMLLMSTFGLAWLAMQEGRDHALAEARATAEDIRAVLMATRRVYQRQFLTHNIELNDDTLGFIPAHAMSRISLDFANWSDSGIRFSNVSDRPRNPANQADPDELEAMDFFRQNPEVKDRLQRIEVAGEPSSYLFTSPIWVEAYCLSCHGRREDAPETIRTRYASAYGYQLGELRGLLSIRIPATLVETRAASVFDHYLTGTLAAAGLTALFLLTLFHRLIHRRLKAISSFAHRFHKGDYQARLDHKGRDEIDRIARALNTMAVGVERRQQALIEQRQLYALLSDVNQMIVHAKSPSEMFSQLCSLTLESPLFEAALVIVPQESGDSRFAYHCAGRCNFVEAWRQLPETRPEWLTGLDPERVLVPVEVWYLDDVPEVWATQAVQEEYASMALLTLDDGNSVVALFSAWSKRKDRFDAATLSLLGEVLEDLRYALQAHRHQQMLVSAERSLVHATLHDAVTDLPNRALLTEELGQALRGAVRNGMRGALLHIVVDDLHLVDEIYGLGTAERVQREIADDLRGAFGGEVRVAVVGPGEYLLLVSPNSAERSDAAEAALQVATYAQEVIGRGHDVDGRPIRWSCTVGVVIYPGRPPHDAEEVLKRASAALGAARSDGEGTIRFYQAEMEYVAERRLSLRHELREAIAGEQFEVWYQPQMSLETGHPIGMEALLRWRHPKRGLLLPGLFIHELERSGMIRDVGWWVLDQACQQVVRWRQQGCWTDAMRCAVNMSPLQLTSDDCLMQVMTITSRYPEVSPLDLELEVTEEKLLDPKVDVTARLEKLRGLGFTIAIDDFGTGYSSLAYLRRLPADVLKIDISFVRELAMYSDAISVVRTIQSFARQFDMRTLAEGVEHVAQYTVLRDEGVDSVQGYLYTQPMDSGAMSEWLVNRIRLEGVRDRIHLADILRESEPQTENC